MKSIIKPFKFKQFDIRQSQNVFKVGTDGVLLGALSNVAGAKKVLEVGTGTGLIALMIAQRNSLAEILALDICPEAVSLAKENFQNSSFSERLSVCYEDFRRFSSCHSYDLIVSNPPYFKENPSNKYVFARQRVRLDFSELIKAAAMNLSSQGVFSVIIPGEDIHYFTLLAEDFGLYLHRLVAIYGIEGASMPKRGVLEFSFQRKAIRQETLTVEKSPRIYTKDYLELTQHFHCFLSKI